VLRIGGVSLGMVSINHFLSLTLVHLERNPGSLVIVLCVRGGNAVLSRDYLTRQASMLLKFAKATTDPNIAAALVEKAADLKSQADSSAQDPTRPAPACAGPNDGLSCPD